MSQMRIRDECAVGAARTPKGQWRLALLPRRVEPTVVCKRTDAGRPSSMLLMCLPPRAGAGPAPVAVPKLGQCPSNWTQSGAYCIEMRRRQTRSLKTQRKNSEDGRSRPAGAATRRDDREDRVTRLRWQSKHCSTAKPKPSPVGRREGIGGRYGCAAVGKILEDFTAAGMVRRHNADRRSRHCEGGARRDRL
jgi:hypothetical protein